MPDPPARSTRRPAWPLALLLVIGLVAGAPAAGKVPQDDARAQALAYLERQDIDGSLAANLVEVAHANGLDPRSWPEGAPALPRVRVPAADAPDIALVRPLRAFALAGDARATQGELADRVAQRMTPDGFGANTTLNDDAFLLLAQAAMEFDDSDREAALRRHLLASQHPSGGWGWALGATPDSDMTGIIVSALAVTGGLPSSAAHNATLFLAGTRAGTGGFAQTPAGAPNCESTVWALRAQRHLAEAVSAADREFLAGLQRADGGFAHVAGGPTDLFCTLEVATLLGEWPDALPFASPPRDSGSGPLVGLAVALLALAARRSLREP